MDRTAISSVANPSFFMNPIIRPLPVRVKTARETDHVRDKIGRELALQAFSPSLERFLVEGDLASLNFGVVPKFIVQGPLDVLPPIHQTRQVNGPEIETGEQILSKPPFADQGVKRLGPKP